MVHGRYEQGQRQLKPRKDLSGWIPCPGLLQVPRGCPSENGIGNVGVIAMNLGTDSNKN